MKPVEILLKCFHLGTVANIIMIMSATLVNKNLKFREEKNE